jgi:hypothetical protein
MKFIQLNIFIFIFSFIQRIVLTQNQILHTFKNDFDLAILKNSYVIYKGYLFYLKKLIRNYNSIFF